MTRLRIGDLLAIPAAPGKSAIAQVVHVSRTNLLIAVHADLVDGDPASTWAAMDLDQPIFLVETMDQRVRAGTWAVFGHAAVPASVTVPTFKTWVEPPGAFYRQDVDGTMLEQLTAEDARGLRTQKSYSPNLVESAVRGFHDLAPWNAVFDEFTV